MFVASGGASGGGGGGSCGLPLQLVTTYSFVLMKQQTKGKRFKGKRQFTVPYFLRVIFKFEQPPSFFLLIFIDYYIFNNTRIQFQITITKERKKRNVILVKN